MSSKHRIMKPLLLMPGLLTLLISGGCDSNIYDDLDPCVATHRLRFVYDYNMKYADAFPSEVRSVAVWAFDENGRMVWSTKDEGEALSSEGYYIDVPLPAGKYQFLTWCGLSSESPFNIANENPARIEDLSVNLDTRGGDSYAYAGEVSDRQFTGLYHGITRDVVITDSPDRPLDQVIEMSLTKDTNYIKILLQNLDGTTLTASDFTFYITAANGRLEYDNSVTDREEFRYYPWKVTLGEADLERGASGTKAITSVSSVLAELSTSRLMADSGSMLVVHRNSDNTDIIRIPLVDYLLLVKGNYRAMSDQEYLDRQDEYSMTFFLDPGKNWYRSMGIYVNSWHVVPPQDTPLQ